MKNKKWWKSCPKDSSNAKKEDESKLKIIARVSEIYKWIDEQQLANKDIAGQLRRLRQVLRFRAI